MMRIEQQGVRPWVLPISPQVVEKLVARVGEPTTQTLIESVQKYEPQSRKVDSFVTLVTSYRARLTGQDKTPHFSFAPTAAEVDALITVWIGSDGNVVERESRLGKTDAWYQWHAPAAVIETLQMMVHDPVFGDFYKKNARTTDADHFNAAACIRLLWVDGNSGYLNDRQAEMLTFVLDAGRNESSIQPLDSEPGGLNSCTVDILKIPTS
jgi:hypothetical protein